MFDEKSAQSAAAQTESGLPREVYALLAQANLLRMRGCWDEAVGRCMAALRLSPDSPSALSLLGDIYENQGRYDDAEQWYRMALDVHPDSPADRLKLELLRRRRPEQESAGESSPELAAGPAPRRRDPEVLLRYATAAAALFALLIVGMAFAGMHSRAALATLGLKPDQEMTLKPVVVPPANSASSSPAILHDPAEQSLLEALRASPVLGADGITVADVQSDPRAGRVTATFSLLLPPGGLTRAAVLQQSLQVVQEAAGQPAAQSASLFTVRCLAADESSPESASLVFVGDLPRGALPNGETAASDPSFASAFSNLWWSPALSS